ncbi:RNA polymerase sigma factor [Streptomyces sp. NPDC054835]
MPDELEGGGHDCPPACPCSTEHAELPVDHLAFLDADLGGDQTTHDRVRRRQVDGQIVEILRQDGFTGPRYEKTVTRLTTYSYNVMSKWAANGDIFTKARQVGRPVPADKITLTWSLEDRQAVVTDSVLGGLQVFHDYGLVGGRWSPDGGAGLDTYFVGAVIRAFPRIYIRWYDTHIKGQAELSRPAGAHSFNDSFAFLPDQQATDPTHHAVTNDMLRRVLPLVEDPQIREALGWRSLGYTQAQAAARVGMTPKALERRMSRLRDRLAQQIGQLEPGEGGTR